MDRENIQKANKGKINKTIHQIYGIFDDGVPLKDITVFYDNVLKTKEFCKKHKLKYKMWNLKMCDDFVKKYYKNYYKLWNDFKKQGYIETPYFNRPMYKEYLHDTNLIMKLLNNVFKLEPGI